MADNNQYPAAEEDKQDENKDDSKQDSKEPEQKKPERKPKPDPGDGLPTKPTDVIEFKWNKEMKDKRSCDTQHMLYLLQLALNLVRLRTIERNKYFKSIGRTDRYINQLDNPQIITNFLDWHNKDKENNKFDGEMLDKKEKLFMINQMISEIGGIKKGPATKVYTKLKKDVVIETTTWLELPQPKLKLETWGYKKMYKNETTLIDCTVEQIITLLTYVNDSDEAWAPPSSDEKKGDDDEKKGDDKPILRGVFQQIKWSNNFSKRLTKKQAKPSALEMDTIINGANAIKKADADKIGKPDCPKEVLDAFDAKCKQQGRWEILICQFFRGEPRKWEFDQGFDEPDPADKAKPTPKELQEAGQLTEQKYGPYDGSKIADGDNNVSVKVLCQQCMNYLIHENVKNAKNKPLNTKLRGGVNQILRELKKCYVDGILKAAAKKK